MRYLVMIEGTETGYSGYVPDLPGCIATASSWKGIRRLLAEAIGLHIEMMEQTGEKVPPPSQRIEFVMDDSPLPECCTWVDVIPPEQTRARIDQLKKNKELSKETNP